MKAIVSFVAPIILLPATLMAQTGPPSLTDGEYHVVLNGIRQWYRVAGASNHTTPLLVLHGVLGVIRTTSNTGSTDLLRNTQRSSITTSVEVAGRRPRT